MPAPGQMVIEEKAETNHPARSQARHMWQDEPQRPDQMRRFGHENLALQERIADQLEIAGLKIAKAAMNQLGGARRSPFGKIAHFRERHGEASARRIAGHGGAVDATADHHEV